MLKIDKGVPVELTRWEAGQARDRELRNTAAAMGVGDSVQFEGYTAAFVKDQARDFIRQAKRASPSSALWTAGDVKGDLTLGKFFGRVWRTA